MSKIRRYLPPPKVKFIAEKLQGYVNGIDDLPGASVISELLQNADDAEATIVKFYFKPNILEVHNNKFFTETNFEGIFQMLAGQKAEQVGKIGAFGTGFISVYHFTDRPELLSATEHYIFDPYQDDSQSLDTEIDQETVFRFPWRLTETITSGDIGAKVWDRGEIEQIKSNFGKIIYRLSIFLRHVKTIEVYDSDNASEHLIYRMVRELISSTDIKNNVKKKVYNLKYYDNGIESENQWLYYSSKIPESEGVLGITIKDYQVTLAFPIQLSQWITQNVPYRLYNFLPTAITTGLNFYINGAFFPDNNRRDILQDFSTQPKKSKWNQTAITEIGKLFVNSLIDIRDHLNDPDRFYNLFPIQLGSTFLLLQPIFDKFLIAAQELEIIFTSINKWKKANNQLFVDAEYDNLQQLAEPYLPLVPFNVNQNLREYLKKKIGLSTLRLQNVLNYLTPNLSSGLALTNAPTMINTITKLSRLYEVIQSYCSKYSLKSSDFETFRNSLQRHPLFLAEDGKLYAKNDNIWCGNDNVRQLDLSGLVYFVNFYLQQKFRFFQEEIIIWQLSASDLLSQYLVSLVEYTKPINLTQAPNILNDRAKLKTLLYYFNKEGITQADFAKHIACVPIVLDNNDNLFIPGAQIYIPDPGMDVSFFEGLGITFVNFELLKETVIADLYTKSGVAHLSASRLIKHLEGLALTQTDLSQATPPLNEINGLLKIYNFLSNHRSEFTENPNLSFRLRHLPIFLNQKEQLLPAESTQRAKNLKLPYMNYQNLHQATFNLLNNETIVHSDLVASLSVQGFLKEIVGIEPLTPFVCIRDFILPNYEDPRFQGKHEDLYQLLLYIHEVWVGLRENEREELKPKLLATNLIRSNDNVYRKGVYLYFASGEVERILHGDYRWVSSSYKLQEWGSFFETLGVNTYPAPFDIVQTVRNLINPQKDEPFEDKVKAIQIIYNFLNREIVNNKNYNKSVGLKELARIKWLPARGQKPALYSPKDIYQTSQFDLIGMQAPVLDGFAEASKELREFLEMPDIPAPELVAQNLLYISSNRSEGATNFYRIYTFIGNNWDKLDRSLQLKLRYEKVIFTENQFWEGSKIYIGDAYRNLFRSRRGYWLQQAQPPVLFFFQKIGVKQSLETDLADNLLLIKEIANAYSKEDKISKEDRYLLFVNWNMLGSRDDLDFKELKKLPIIPDWADHLYQPDRIVIADASQNFFLDTIGIENVPILNDAQAEGFPFTEAAYRFVRNIGVKSVKEVYHRRLVRAEDEHFEQEATDNLHRLFKAFRRISRAIEERQNVRSLVGEPIETILEITIVSVSKLVVEAYLDNGVDWNIRGNQFEEKALYLPSENKMIVLRDDTKSRFRYVPLAKELEGIFFPLSNESTTIEQLLDEMSEEEIDLYLDMHDYRRLHEEIAFVVQLSSKPIEPTGFIDGVSSEEPTQTDLPGIVIPKPSDLENNEINYNDSSLKGDDAPAIGNPKNPVIPINGNSGSNLRPPKILNPNPAISKEEDKRSQSSTLPEVIASTVRTTEFTDWEAEIEPEKVEIRAWEYNPIKKETAKMSPRTSKGKSKRSVREKRTPEQQTLLSSQAKRDIGWWGEKYVLEFLKQKYEQLYDQDDTLIVEEDASFEIIQNGINLIKIIWQNAIADAGEGCDILIQENDTLMFVEVKSSKNHDKEWFDLSRLQWEMAKMHKEKFYLFRVYGAGTEQAKLVQIHNPYNLWLEENLVAYPIRVQL